VPDPRDLRTAEDFSAALRRETDRTLADDLRRHGEVRRWPSVRAGDLPSRNAADERYPTPVGRGRRVGPRIGLPTRSAPTERVRQLADRMMAAMRPGEPTARQELFQAAGEDSSSAWKALYLLRDEGRIAREGTGPRGARWRLRGPVEPS
jgi:hypothetical protein